MIGCICKENSITKFEMRSAENVGRASKLRRTKIFCTIGADSSRFHRRSLGRHHFGSYVFKPQVLLQEVGAEPLNVAATLHVASL